MIGYNYFYLKKYFAYQSAANLNFHEKKQSFWSLEEFCTRFDLYSLVLDEFCSNFDLYSLVLDEFCSNFDLYSLVLDELMLKF